MSALGTLAALPRAVTEFSNILLTTSDRPLVGKALAALAVATLLGVSAGAW